MKLRILGCSGGELRKHRTTCFLLDGSLAIDAGALTAALSLDELVRIDDIVLTHSHLDHVKDVPLLADLLIGRREKPVVIHASTECAQTLRKNIFNGELWPDFTRLPSARQPVIEIRPFEPRRRFKIGRYTFRPIPVRHPVESVGFVVSDEEGALAISGDTGPTTAFWRVVSGVERLRMLLVETSFPTRLQQLADRSGHLTPSTLAGELAKLERDDLPILLYHLKPAYQRELHRELADLNLANVRVLVAGEIIEF